MGHCLYVNAFAISCMLEVALKWILGQIHSSGNTMKDVEAVECSDGAPLWLNLLKTVVISLLLEYLKILIISAQNIANQGASCNEEPHPQIQWWMVQKPLKSSRKVHSQIIATEKISPSQGSRVD